MKCMRVVAVSGIAIVTLVALLLSGSIDASAASLPQRIDSPPVCGKWSKVASPNVGTSSNSLNGVAAISSNDVWAVGDYANSNGGLTFTEHWNGSKWKVVPSPNVNNSLSNSLSGVAAIAANNVWAVGSYNDPSNTVLTLIEHWDGSQWSIVQSPNVPFVFNTLTAISFVSATDIWAVGNLSGNNGFQPLFEHWNGTSWSIVQSQGAGQLNAVAAIASNDVWAVGTISGSNIQTLTEHWNGSAWSVVSSSGPGLAINHLNAVVALSTNNVWAAGDDTDTEGPSAGFSPLFEHWNGTAWSVVAGPMRGTSDFVNAIAAVSASDIWAVGNYRASLGPYGPYFTFIEHWNGKSWNKVKSPNPGTGYDDLLAVAGVPATSSVWAVGIKRNGVTYQTLAEFYC